MSEAGNPAPEATLIEQEGAIPETVVPVEAAPEPEKPAEEAPKAEAAPETPAEPPKPPRKPWYQQRIDTLTIEKTKEREAREALEAKLAQYEKPAEGEQAAFKPEQFEDLVKQQARALVAQERQQERAQAWVQAGAKEYGAAEFNEMCAEVAAMGVGDSREFMAIITDPDVIPEGHKVIASLRENPAEVQRILAMDPIKQAIALSKLASQPAKAAPKPVSSAPAPIKGIDGTAKSTALDDSQDMKTWLANRNATARTTAGGQPNSRH